MSDVMPEILSPLHTLGTLSAPRASLTPAVGRRITPADVHKTTDTEVLLTGSRRLGEDRFEVAAHWPRNHFLHQSAVDPGIDPLLMMETVRQSAIHLSHEFYHVPDTFPFVMLSLEVDLDPATAIGGGSPLPPPILLTVTLTRTTAHAHRHQLALDADIRIAGRPCGRASTRWEAMDPRCYHALRRRGRAQAPTDRDAAERPPVLPLPPAVLGYEHQRDVLLAASTADTAGTWLLDLDRSHPVLFEHSSDHIPGMVLAEAFRQACLLTGGANPAAHHRFTTGRITFETFGELDPPVAITVRPEPSGTVHLTAVQQGRQLATAQLHGARRNRDDSLVAPQREVTPC
ncbi:ScbA/BarX family gamma-butyrolactone biosynthesis protein [Streptomyces sp. NPDC092296]|uniref:ScbA/BarX family gamma-butyrolactone biosynthesis protein n=1 Tax=Streptomyces sp. NPDC092296 TaxID=3366012 RepID=UPI003805C7A4